MLDDPLDFPRPYRPQPVQRDPRENFWQHVPDMRPTEGRENPGTFRICRYLDGRHEMPPKPWCNHYRPDSETGRKVPENWTAQES